MAAAAVALAGCGGGSGGGPRTTVQRYLKAISSGDAAGACGQMTEKSREKLGEFAHDTLGAGDSCQDAIGVLLRSQAGSGLKQLGKARITRVETDGDKGEVRVDGLDRPIDVTREEGDWRIESSPTGETD